MPWREGLAMNRQVIIAGLVAFGLLLFVFIVATMAAPCAMPQLQIPENPNNNTCDTAQQVPVGGSVLGSINPITDTDWYSVTTVSGDPYVASASVGPADFKVRLCVYAYVSGSCALMSCSTASDSYVERSWDANGDLHFVKVEKFDTITETNKTTSYVLEIVEEYVPPPTNTPTHSPTPTNTPPPSSADEYETYDSFTDNNEPSRAYVLPVTTYLKFSTYLGVATFHTTSDTDWYAFWAKDDEWYQVTTSGLSGVDTYVTIYKDNGTKKVTSNDDGGGGYASLASFEASYDGYYYVKVTNKVATLGSYDMVVEKIGEPTPGPTVTPGPGANSKVDPCEDNLDFDHACIIAANDPKKFNFVPPYGGVDNDYFKLRIKPGYNYKCFTSDLDAGVDPNMIVYDQNRNGIGGNDDVEPGDLNSSFSYYATYEGWLYILVGYGDRTPSDIYNSNYTLECQSEVPGEPTAVPAATSGPAAATSTPRPSAAPPTATPFVGLKIRPLTTPTPVPETPSEPIVVPINLLVYYDANGDGQPGAGEGIAGISAQAYDASTNTLLAQGVTDAQGHLEFTVTAQGPVRVSVPFFGFSQLVTEETTIRLRVLSLARP
jgi:hypothetical protein